MSDVLETDQIDFFAQIKAAADGLMVAEAFSFPDTQTVGKVLRNLASADDDFGRYRGQHPLCR